jgi:hypothetical protein
VLKEVHLRVGCIRVKLGIAPRLSLGPALPAALPLLLLALLALLFGQLCLDGPGGRSSSSSSLSERSDAPNLAWQRKKDGKRKEKEKKKRNGEEMKKRRGAGNFLSEFFCLGKHNLSLSHFITIPLFLLSLLLFLSFLPLSFHVIEP